MSDWISREAAIGALEDRRNKYLEDGPNWLQIQMDILTITALPAVQPDTDELVGHMTNLIAAGLDRIEQLTAERDRLREALLDHNDLLRSAIAIAEREGVRGEIASTNWDAYYNRAAVVLKRHHQITTDARAALKGESHE